MKINIEYLSYEHQGIANYQYQEINKTIDNLVNNEFNINHQLLCCDNVPLEKLLTQLIIGSQKIRFGASPSQSCQYSLEVFIKNIISQNQPIPIVVPVGPYKTSVHENTDLAEIYALKTLGALYARINFYYSPGVIFYLREEDITGWFLTGTDDDTIASIERYMTNLETLIQILGYEKFIFPFRESELSSFEDILSLINVYSPPLRKYLLDTNDILDEFSYSKYSSYKILSVLGWRGIIPRVQRDFYREGYARNYPHKTSSEINEMLVEYLSISFAKSKLNALFPKVVENGFIQLNFVPPVPGIPNELVSKRVYYRVLPTVLSKTTNIAFWRAKGFLSLHNSHINFSLINWHTSQNFIEHKIKLIKDNKSVILSADIYLKCN